MNFNSPGVLNFKFPRKKNTLSLASANHDVIHDQCPSEICWKYAILWGF